MTFAQKRWFEIRRNAWLIIFALISILLLAVALYLTYRDALIPTSETSWVPIWLPLVVTAKPMEQQYSINQNIFTEALGIIITVLLIDILGELRAKRRLRRRLITMMSSTHNQQAVTAAEEMKERGWLLGPALMGADLVEANLAGVNIGFDTHFQMESKMHNLRHARLRNANLAGAKLHHVDFYGADLSGADLYMANLAGANLAGTDLRGANLQYANLAGVRFRERVGEKDVWAIMDDNTVLPNGSRYTSTTTVKEKLSYMRRERVRMLQYGINPIGRQHSLDNQGDLEANWRKQKDILLHHPLDMTQLSEFKEMLKDVVATYKPPRPVPYFTSDFLTLPAYERRQCLKEIDKLEDKFFEPRFVDWNKVPEVWRELGIHYPTQSTQQRDAQSEH